MTLTAGKVIDCITRKSLLENGSRKTNYLGDHVCLPYSKKVVKFG